MITEITLDFDRPKRIGLSEAIYCAHKSVEQLIAITEQVIGLDKSMLYTRLSETYYASLEKTFAGALDYDPVSRTALYRPAKYQPSPSKTPQNARVAIVTGGSSDVPIAREALRTLEFFSEAALEIHDVGVAGLWRIQERLEELATRDVIICVAGMDAALPTVLGGLVPGLIIAVPSSVGYGVANGGNTALNALLCSCAPGLVVVNIDNGYGAACAALRSLGKKPLNQ